MLMAVTIGSFLWPTFRNQTVAAHGNVLIHQLYNVFKFRRILQDLFIFITQYLHEVTYRGANLWGLKPEWWWWSPGRLALGWVAADPAHPARPLQQVDCCPTGSAGSKRSGDPAWGRLLWNWLQRLRSPDSHYPCRFTPPHPHDPDKV